MTRNRKPVRARRASDGAGDCQVPMGDCRLGPALALGVRKSAVRSLTVAALLVATLFAAANPAFAQSGGGYNIKKSTIDGGGVTFHTGGAYRLGGTVGQHDADNLSGGGCKLTGGFWSPVAAPGNIVWDANDLTRIAPLGR